MKKLLSEKFVKQFFALRKEAKEIGLKISEPKMPLEQKVQLETQAYARVIKQRWEKE